MKFDCNAPIGVFDSGVGGLSVLQHIHRVIPHESLLYVADSGFAPYGDKPASLILERSIAVTDFLLNQSIKALVVACNTATASAIRQLRERYPELIIIGMEPGLKPAAQISKTKKVGVLATRLTIQSEKYLRLHEQLAADTGVTFISQACVGLVDQIEKSDPSSLIRARELLEQYISPLLDEDVDTLVLGCTHYPFVADMITDITSLHRRTSPPIQLIDTGYAIALHLQRLLSQHVLESNNNTPANIIAYATGDSDRLARACKQWLQLHGDQLHISALHI